VVTGTYAEGDLLAVDGRIAETGPGVTAPADAELRDLRGGFVLPGLMTRMCTSRPSPRIWGRWDPCPLPNDLARSDALSWSRAILDGRLRSSQVRLSVERRWEWRRLSLKIARITVHRACARMRMASTATSEWPTARNSARGGLDGIRQTMVTHDASRARFNVNGQDHLSRDNPVVLSTPRWRSPRCPVPANLSYCHSF
jgi:hypothetical protein